MRTAVFVVTAVALVAPIGSAQEPSFEVATIKPTAPDDRSGRFLTMQGAHQLVVKGYTLKFMVAAAHNLPPRLIAGGPAWADSDRYDIVAATPGDNRPTLDQQMAMLRTLLAERFKLAIHHESRELPVYELTVARRGAKLETSTAPDQQPLLVNKVFPTHIELPARNATMAQFASMLQRSVLDRPVVDKTGLAGRYDFNLEWTPDDTQFDGRLPPSLTTSGEKPDLVAALEAQIGLKLETSRGSVDVIVIDSVDRPTV
ncbi:MAG TPA: TIGR03435 family protein [Vicinamibacterales bacterium]